MSRQAQGRAPRAALALSLLLCAAAACAGEPGSVSEVRDGFAASRRIVTEDGIDDRRMVEIGGIAQAITVRGRHRDAPMLLFLHGGPGFAMSPVAYRYTDAWEEYFTVVHWDQRGAGRTYAANDAAAVTPTLSVPRMIADAEEVVAWLRRTYGRERIAVLGHSWGSVLGAELVLRRPQWISVYAGVGQVVDMQASEALGYRQLLEMARRREDAGAVRELEALAPYPGDDPARAVEKLVAERRHLESWANGFLWRGRGNDYTATVALSPDYTPADAKALDAGLDTSLAALWPQLLRYSLRGRTELKVPLVLLQGRHDMVTSSALAAQWFGDVRAPSKTLVWFEDSAHMPPMEEPGKLLVHLVRDVLPLARAGAAKTAEAAAAP
ncbi:alpha/beta fold hydrolase [Luteimonas aquatica]|uniref:alpha/beta fold hydrolase n=1 Tax=Luteimonas aquatica TaxID=450364 RepID=UPI001F5ADB1E|nr:alpha/beta fold hydrolase [Luteimonas aquatica]